MRLVWLRFHDVTHALKPVTAGRRLTLTYHLVHENLGPDVLAASSNKTFGKLDMLFSYWHANVQEEVLHLGYLLDGKYRKNPDLSFDMLEGADKETVTYLRDAGSKHGVCIYLAELTRWVDLNDYDDDWGADDSDCIDQESACTYLTNVVELDGTQIAQNLFFEDDFLVQEDAFEAVDYDEHLYQESRAIYHRTVWKLVLVPTSI
ncbi:MAG: hypothetical protein CL912_28595 [Deltaproteobacteria bacterium]|nr:hypothetical protein [Deltaproteobacteria bacterium]|tara:strand:- start:6 stop:620 length:615 start_codon:yes stop_codon:yes gene_type:complete